VAAGLRRAAATPLVAAGPSAGVHRQTGRPERPNDRLPGPTAGVGGSTSVKG
jgi:hypothetical protein